MNTDSLLLLPDKSRAITPSCKTNSLKKSSSPVVSEISYSTPPLSMGGTFQNPQWVPETVDHTGPYIHCVFFSIPTYLGSSLLYKLGVENNNNSKMEQ